MKKYVEDFELIIFNFKDTNYKIRTICFMI